MWRIILCLAVIVSTLQVLSLEESLLKDVQTIESTLSHSTSQVRQIKKTATLFTTLSSSLNETNRSLTIMQSALTETRGSLNFMKDATTQIHGHISSITRSTGRITASIGVLDKSMNEYRTLSVELQKNSLLVADTIKKLAELSTSLQDEFKGIVEQMKRPGIQKLLQSLKKQETK